MKDMALPPFLGGKKSSSTKHMLALDIGLEVVTASLWTVEDARAKVLKISSPIEWQEERPDELAEAADVALEELGKQATEIDEIVLGLQEDWIENDHILPAKKPLLRVLSDQLKLKPVGFVVSREALIAYLQELEGSPLSAMCIEYTTASLAVFPVKAGVKGKTVTVGRSEDSISDLSEAISRLHLDSYPSRIIIFSARMKQEELEQEKQHLLSFDWKKDFPFLHIPKIETLPHNALITSVCVAGGTEIAKSMQSVEVPAEEMNAAPAVHAEAVKEHEMPTAEDLGFTEVSAEDHEKVANEEEQEEVVPTKPSKKPFVLPEFPPIGKKIKSVVNRMFSGKNLSAKFSDDTSNAKRMRILLAGVVLVLVVSAVLGWFALSATARALVDVTIKTVPVSQEVQITLDPFVAQSDPEHGVLKVESVEKEVTGQMEAETTGTKIVGDLAKGKVTIYNATSGEKVFPAGTILTGPNNLRFTTDVAVTVASSSGTAEQPQSGSAVVAITASNIGTESNLPAKSEFMVANFDKKTYIAKNEEGFAGGSSREIQAVSKDDLTRLENLLTKQLQEEALNALTAEQEEGSRIIPLGTTTVSGKTFDAKAGDEARNVTLTMSMTAAALRYNVSDLLPVAVAMLKSVTPEGAVLREERTQIDPGDVIESTGSATTLKAVLSSELIPQVNKDAWAGLIRGRTVAQAISILREQNEIGGVEINIQPRIAQMILGTIPNALDRIVVQTKVSSL